MISESEFLDLVPWREMEMGPHWLIRSRVTNACPICAVWGGWNSEASMTAARHGLPRSVAVRIMRAADGVGDIGLQAEMRRRLSAAHTGGPNRG